MAKAEGWLQKQGSKWQTMPDLMLRYRAAAFFARQYAPELTMGMHTAEEVADVVEIQDGKGNIISNDIPEKPEIRRK